MKFEDWFDRGVELDKLGKYTESLAAFERAILLKSDEANAWIWRGLALIELNRQ